MANINKIRLSGQTYNIEDVNATKTLELTQAQYDALVSGGTVDPNTFYIITDATGGDLSNYYKKTETSGATEIQTALDAKLNTSDFNTYSANTQTAINGKQDTLVAGSGITISGNVISAEAQPITVDPSLDSGSTNPVENRVIYNKIDEVEQVTAAALNNINDRLSEDEEVTAAGLNAVNDKFDGLKLKKLSQAEYDALSPNYDSNTLYVIV